ARRGAGRSAGDGGRCRAPVWAWGCSCAKEEVDGTGQPRASHICFFFSDSTLPPLASQSFAFLAMVKLCPLQSFFPLQSWLALLQLPLPLQSFVPSQWTPFVALSLPAKATEGAIKVASAPAMATPFNVPFFIESLLAFRDLLSLPPPALHAWAEVRASRW